MSVHSFMGKNGDAVASKQALEGSKSHLLFSACGVFWSLAVLPPVSGDGSLIQRDSRCISTGWIGST